MKIHCCTLLCLVLCAFGRAEGHRVTGRVVAHRGVAGVVVTDGYDTTRTDRAGRFALDTDPRARFVYLSTPSGYRPEGPFYRALDPDPGPVEFRLAPRPAAADGRIRFVHFSDGEARIYKDWIDMLKAYVEANDPDFVLFSGDICYEKGLRMHRRTLNDRTLGTRMAYSVGNHDLVDGPSGEALYEECFGPAWYSFNAGGVHFVVLPVLYGDRKPSYTADVLYTWLRRDLDALPAGTPVVLFDHHLQGYDPAADRFILRGEHESLDMAGYNLRAYLYGHYHTNFGRTTRDGVRMFCSMAPNKGGIDHTAASMREVTVDAAGNLSSRLVYTDLRGLLVPHAEEHDGAMHLTVHAYDSRTRVREVVLQTDGRHPVRLEPVNDWVWTATCTVPARGTLVATFEDGSVVRTPLVRDEAVRRHAVLPSPVLFAAPLCTPEGIVVGTLDDNDTHRAAVRCYDRSGTLRWELTTRNSVKGRMACADSTIVAVDVEGNCYAIDSRTGRLRWQHDLRGESSPHPVATEGVAVADGVVYAGMGSRLTALRLTTGKVLWRNTAWRGGVNTVSPPLVVDGVLLASGYWKGRFGHDAATGRLLWQKTDQGTRIADGAPVGVEGHFLYTTPEALVEVEPASGREVARAEVGAALNSGARPLVVDTMCYVATSERGLVALDRKHGYRKVWQYLTRPARIYTTPYAQDYQMSLESTPVMAAGLLFFGASDGCLYAVDPRTGTYVWRFDTGAPVTADLAAEGDTVWATDFGGVLWQIDAARVAAAGR